MEGKGNENPLAKHLKNLKKRLRSQQRQLVAEHRKEKLEEISRASTGNTQLFYRLVREQRGTNKPIPDCIEFPTEDTTQLNGWANYFENLATMEDLPHFNESHHTNAKIKLHQTVLILKTNCEMIPVQLVSEVPSPW